MLTDAGEAPGARRSGSKQLYGTSCLVALSRSEYSIIALTYMDHTSICKMEASEINPGTTISVDGT